LPLALYGRIQSEIDDHHGSLQKLTGAEPLTPLQ
jgi:hypothetical protein